MTSSIASDHLSRAPIAVIGLGYVGLPLAVEFGKRRRVIGFDVKADRIEALRAGHDHTREVSPEELAQASHLAMTSDPAALPSIGNAIGRAYLPEVSLGQGMKLVRTIIDR